MAQILKERMHEALGGHTHRVKIRHGYWHSPSELKDSSTGYSMPKNWKPALGGAQKLGITRINAKEVRLTTRRSRPGHTRHHSRGVGACARSSKSPASSTCGSS